jgi:hypothetical protein
MVAKKVEWVVEINSADKAEPQRIPVSTRAVALELAINHFIKDGKREYKLSELRAFEQRLINEELIQMHNGKFIFIYQRESLT